MHRNDVFDLAQRSSPRIHITGGRGRLATLVSAQLRSRGYVVELYSRTAGEGFNDINHLLEGKCLAQGDSIFHMAWCTLPLTSEQGRNREDAEDIPLLQRLLATLGRFDFDTTPHFVFFSSGGTVYGNAGALPSRESDPCRPIGAYGRAKLAAEQIIQQHCSVLPSPCAVLRISNPYGHRGDPTRPQGVINRAIACALSGEEFVVWGDGGARKDYLYQQDFVAALESVVRRRLVGTYNLCMGESHTVNQVIVAVESCTGRRIARRYTPAPAWDVQDSRLDGELLQRLTSWRPSVSFREGVERSVECFFTTR